MNPKFILVIFLHGSYLLEQKNSMNIVKRMKTTKVLNFFMKFLMKSVNFKKGLVN